MSRLYEVDCDDLIVNITFAWEGAIAIVRPEDAGALVSHRFPTYQLVQNATLPDFFRYPILDKQFIYNLGVISPGGAGRNRVLNKADFLKIELALPKIDEQQKIADCLSSLDDLIAAEDRKLEALRQHKQGLMQQLFPQPGETVPRLRFPKFTNAPHWLASTVGKRCESFSGGTPDTSNRAYYGGTIPFIRSAEIDKDKTELFLSEDGLTDSAAKMVRYGDVLVALYGANSGDTALARIEGAINQAIICLRSRESAQFLYQYLTARKDWIISTYLQGGQGNLSGRIVLSAPITVPRIDEQEKVANCLGSLDDLIAAEDRKLEALRQHKRGLMQQLFPQLNGR